MAVRSIRAFSDKKYSYYRLTRDLGNLRQGAIFYHDPDDKVFGSIARGCLKLCWTPDGNCYTYCGGCVVLPYDFANTSLFEKAGESFSALKPGRYELVVMEDGTWDIRKIGRV